MGPGVAGAARPHLLPVLPWPVTLCGSPGHSYMAWQTALLWVKDKVRECGQEGRGTRPCGLDRGCISPSSAQWQGPCPEAEKAESGEQKGNPGSQGLPPAWP